MRKSKICCSLNYAPHYREEIFLRMEQELDCTFYFGNRTYGDIKKADYKKFKQHIVEFKFIPLFKNLYYLKGQAALSFKNYSHYIITGQPYNLSSWLLLFFNAVQGKKTFIWNHGCYGKEGGIKKILKRLQIKLASGYFLYGNYAKNLMVNEGFDSNKLKVLYNSLDYTKQLKIRKNIQKTSVYIDQFGNDNPTLLFIGRLTKVKQLDLLLEAITLAKKQHKKYNLVFIGKGTEQESLEKLAKALAVKKQVWFYGACYDEEKLGELIYNADVCVSPGNVGLTAIHSLMFGTPVMTHNNFKNQMPEFEAIEENITGCFFEEGNLKSLQDQISNWLEIHPNKEERLIENCFTKIDQYYNPAFQLKVLKEVLK